MKNNLHYVYMLCDPREPGEWDYKGVKFSHRPFYAGKGKGGRIDNHFSPSSLSSVNIKNIFLHKILAEGMDTIRTKLFEGLTDNESKEIEIDIIAHFGRIDLKTGILSNLTAGGDGAKGSVKSTEWKDWLSRTRTGKFFPSLKSRYLLQLSLDGELIKQWDSISEAERELRIPKSQLWKSIREAPDDPFYGFFWKRGDLIVPLKIKMSSPKIKIASSKIRIPSKSTRRKPSFQYSLDGDFIQKFDSITDARKQYGGRIIAQKGGKPWRALGYQWLFEDLGPKIAPMISKSELLSANALCPVLAFSPKFERFIFYSGITVAYKSEGMQWRDWKEVFNTGKLSKNGLYFKSCPSTEELEKIAFKASELVAESKEMLSTTYQTIADLNIPEVNEIILPLLLAA
jgi:hypothetical protein